MKRYLILIASAGCGFVGGLLIVGFMNTPEDGEMNQKHQPALVSAARRNESSNLTSFIKGRIPEPAGPRATWFAGERLRLNREMKSPFRSSAVLGQVIEDLSKDELVAMLENRTFSSVEEMVRVFARLAEIDPVWAMEVRQNTRQSIQEMDESIKAIFSVWVRSNASQALDWSYHLPSSGSRQANSLFLTEEWLKVDPRAVAENFDRLQHARGYGHFADGFEDQLMKAWVSKDADEAERWLNQLPSGDKKDHLTKAFEKESGKSSEEEGNH